MANLSPLGRKYNDRYTRFSEQMHHAWMHYAIQPVFREIVKEFCSRDDDSTIVLEQLREVFEESDSFKDDPTVVFQRMSPINPNEGRQHTRIRVKNLTGMMGRYYKSEIPESVFINSIGLFEAFVADVAKLAYLDNPEYLLAENKKEDNPTERENLKLLRIFIESRDLELAMDQYVDNFLTGIFYGNPIKVFTTDKLRFDIHGQISSRLESELILYAEMTARRNVIVHNMGKADKKYTKTSGYVKSKKVKDENGKKKTQKLTLKSRFLEEQGNKVVINDEYLYTTILTLNEIAKRYIHELAIKTTDVGIPSVRL